MRLSTRNQLKGKITEVEIGAVMAVVKVTLDGGDQVVTSSVTKDAATDLGLKVRAVRRNRAISGCLGIDTARIDMTIFAFGSGLAGVAGAVLAPIKSVSTAMGFPYAVDSYMVLVLGGVGSLWGVLTGGALIGEAETILSFIFNNVIGRLLVFLFIVIIIRIVPRGIFGYSERR